jgi:hypothetical protein
MKLLLLLWYRLNPHPDKSNFNFNNKTQCATIFRAVALMRTRLSALRAGWGPGCGGWSVFIGKPCLIAPVSALYHSYGFVFFRGPRIIPVLLGLGINWNEKQKTIAAKRRKGHIKEEFLLRFLCFSRLFLFFQIRHFKEYIK